MLRAAPASEAGPGARAWLRARRPAACALAAPPAARAGGPCTACIATLTWCAVRTNPLRGAARLARAAHARAPRVSAQSVHCPPPRLTQQAAHAVTRLLTLTLRAGHSAEAERVRPARPLQRPAGSHGGRAGRAAGRPAEQPAPVLARGAAAAAARRAGGCGSACGRGRRGRAGHRAGRRAARRACAAGPRDGCQSARVCGGRAGGARTTSRAWRGFAPPGRCCERGCCERSSRALSAAHEGAVRSHAVSLSYYEPALVAGHTPVRRRSASGQRAGASRHAPRAAHRRRVRVRRARAQARWSACWPRSAWTRWMWRARVRC